MLVLEFCQGQWGMKRRGRQRQKLGRQELRWKKKKRRGRGDQVLVLEILSVTVGNETPGTSTRETGTPETAMEEKETSRT